MATSYTIKNNPNQSAEILSHGENIIPAGSAESIRELPYNLQAEKGLLGSILINNGAHENVTEFLKPEHFSYERHGKIYEALNKLIERGQIADGVTLQRFFEHDQSLAEIGGAAYLAELVSAAATIINAGEYGLIIYDLHLKRELINLGGKIVNRAFGAEVDETGLVQIESADGARSWCAFKHSWIPGLAFRI